ncbi:hypothetical protein AG1IA_08160 [Rhizoctonia solani AG-1 IA]|uniref:Uncharacterized protein n=1 Tax=Thanatephorus cucumeris (strain AG1-IA) TaxID=983506 RepID=L8WM28_THACA|nr:hypothetical protein AG1IA_08160 [Rhizoctonia solani AG-1 IA]
MRMFIFIYTDVYGWRKLKRGFIPRQSTFKLEGTAIQLITFVSPPNLEILVFIVEFVTYVHADPRAPGGKISCVNIQRLFVRGGPDKFCSGIGCELKPIWLLAKSECEDDVGLCE